MRFFEKPKQENKQGGFREQITEDITYRDPKSLEFLKLQDRQKEIGQIPVIKKYLELQQRRDATIEDINRLSESLREFVESGNNTEEEKFITQGAIKRLDWKKKYLPQYEKEAEDYLSENLDVLQPLINEASKNQDLMNVLEKELGEMYNNNNGQIINN